MKRSKNPDRVKWPKSFAEGNERRIELIHREIHDNSLSEIEKYELQALEIMTALWLDSRFPIPKLTYRILSEIKILLDKAPN